MANFGLNLSLNGRQAVFGKTGMPDLPQGYSYLTYNGDYVTFNGDYVIVKV